MSQEIETRQSLEAIAERLRTVAHDLETVAETPSTAEAPPEQRQWHKLRHIARVVERLTTPNLYDHAKRDWSVSRLREMADSLEDMYEENRDR